jgi:membrane protein required for colicin V production
MTVFDYAVLAIIGVSVLLSLMRGLVREMLGLAGWVAAFFVARLYVLEVAPLLPAAIPNESLRLMAAFAIIFLTTLLAVSLITILLGELVKQVGLSVLDRGLGAVFGFARGLLVVAVLVLLGGMTSLPQDARWRNAMFSAPLEAMVLACKPWLPEEMTKYLKY